MTTLNEMANSKVTVIIKTKENILQSFFKGLVTFSFLAFCIYISQGSTWWTFITGSMFLIYSLAKVGNVINKAANVFDNKKDAIAYIEELSNE